MIHIPKSATGARRVLTDLLCPYIWASMIEYGSTSGKQARPAALHTQRAFASRENKALWVEVGSRMKKWVDHDSDYGYLSSEQSLHRQVPFSLGRGAAHFVGIDNTNKFSAYGPCGIKTSTASSAAHPESWEEWTRSGERAIRLYHLVRSPPHLYMKFTLHGMSRQLCTNPGHWEWKQSTNLVSAA